MTEDEDSYFKKFENYLYVYRKSYKFYSDVSLFLSIGKFVFSASSLSAFAFLPLASLSMVAGVIEIVDKALQVSERREEYKFAYKFYKYLLNSLKAKTISVEEALIKEEEFVKDLKYFPMEKYLKKKGLNGY